MDRAGGHGFPDRRGGPNHALPSGAPGLGPVPQGPGQSSSGNHGAGAHAAGPVGAAAEALRLRALARFTKLLAGATSTAAVVGTAATEAHRELGAAAVSISVWERESGLLRVLVNHGELAEEESELPEDETYPVFAFPSVLLSEDDLGPWVQLAETGTGDPYRVDLLRRRGRSCALIAPIVFGGLAWGELYAARNPDQPIYHESDLDYAEALTAQIAAGLARSGEREQIERLAFTDQLTGLANRRLFDARLDAAMDRHNTDGTVVSLVLCDGNGLKRINDQHGHDHGDALLVELGACVSAAASRLPRALAARLGGDEFCLLIEGFTADDAVAAAEELCLRSLTVRGGEGMSCGVASTGDPIGRVATRDGLFRLADAAQYRAKRSRSLSPVVAGRGQPPDPELPQQQRGVPVAATRGRASAPIEALLGQALAGLDKLPPSALQIDRVELIVDQVARGLDAASWYIYLRAGNQGPLYQERSAVYRAASESGSHDLPGRAGSGGVGGSGGGAGIVGGGSGGGIGGAIGAAGAVGAIGAGTRQNLPALPAEGHAALPSEGCQAFPAEGHTTAWPVERRSAVPAERRSASPIEPRAELPAESRVEISPTSAPQWIEPIPRIAEQLRGFGAVTPAVGQDSNWAPGDLGISPEFLAAAGYTSCLSAGATAPDGSQWLVAVLLDEISLWALPALPLLRVLLATSLGSY
ncbi:MAG TPA: diguanylate cyclase [Actinospica sp.]|nr:diguanylate cyclase [Actinospica sp.]